MEPLSMLAIGAAAGLAKSELIDRPKEDRQRKLAAATQRYSPWTGLAAQPIQEADSVGTPMEFGLTGYQMGLNEDGATTTKDLLQSQIALNAAQTAKLATPQASPMASYQYTQPRYGVMGGNPWGGLTSPDMLERNLGMNYGY